MRAVPLFFFLTAPHRLLYLFFMQMRCKQFNNSKHLAAQIGILADADAGG
ncbi:MAG: hypothetical protein QG667_1064 [Pseudomonadota bacterium]|nr:hypothetical protein [Pseudomonadota bacterium]